MLPSSTATTRVAGQLLLRGRPLGVSTRRALNTLVPEATKSKNKQHSDAAERIAKAPVILVKGSVAICDGGGGALGHPVEYIQLAKRSEHQPETCKYCGLRFMHDDHGHDDHATTGGEVGTSKSVGG